MKKTEDFGLAFEIDKLTNSIENVITGDCFRTEVALFLRSELALVSKQKHWVFNWNTEYQSPKKEVYKLTIAGNNTVIQGLISLEIMADHIFVHLLENAPFNKGKEKVYAGVAGNLMVIETRAALVLIDKYFQN